MPSSWGNLQALPPKPPSPKESRQQLLGAAQAGRSRSGWARCCSGAVSLLCTPSAAAFRLSPKSLSCFGAVLTAPLSFLGEGTKVSSEGLGHRMAPVATASPGGGVRGCLSLSPCVQDGGTGRCWGLASPSLEHYLGSREDGRRPPAHLMGVKAFGVL